MDTADALPRLLRWREPAAWVLLAVLALRLVAVATVLVGFASAPDESGPVWIWQSSYLLATPVELLALLGVLLAGHRTPVVQRLRTLTVAALLLTAASLLVTLGTLLLGLGLADPAIPMSGPDLADRLLALVLPLLVLGALVVLVSRPAGPEDDDLDVLDETDADDPEPAPDPDLAPTWAADTAAGAAWTSAGDAAAGRPAAGWGTSSSAGSGWGPRPETLEVGWKSPENPADQVNDPPRPDEAPRPR